MAVLKFRNLNTGQATPIPPGDFTIGREDDAYVHVEDVSVSRHHARIYNLDDGFFLEDTGSANGTAARGALINGRVKLEMGDVVYIGSVPYRLDPEKAAGPAEAPSAGLRAAKKSYMTRNTERIPASVTDAFRAHATSAPATPTVQPTPLGNLAAPPELPGFEVAAPAVEATPPPRLPTVRRGTTPLPGDNIQLPAATPISMPGLSPVNPPSAPEPAPAPVVATMEASPSPSLAPPVSAPVYVPEPELRGYPPPTPGPTAFGLSGTPLLVALATVFLAGLAVGMMVGLYFASLFLQMGGKPGPLH